MRTSALLMVIMSMTTTLAAGCASGDSRSDAEVDRLMRVYADDGPGAALLVLRDGVPVVRRGYGMADLETGAAATPATNYRLASISKQFTATAILLLVQDGLLRLDAPVRRWLPSLPAATDAITIRHLLTHSSGVIDYEDLMQADSTAQVRDADVLTLLEGRDELYFAPGTDYRYSNSGYALLALVVEQASQQSFQAFLQQRIFAPLAMDQTLAYVRGGPAVANRAYGYSHLDGQWLGTDQSPTSAVLGDGGIYSNIDDLARWDAALHDDRLLTAESRRLAFTEHVATDEAGVGYGFGWRISDGSVWHSGESIGFRNVLVRYPGQRLTVIVLSNRNHPEPRDTATAIAAHFLGR